MSPTVGASPPLHPQPPGTVGKTWSRGLKVLEEDGVGKQVKKPSKGSWPSGEQRSSGPLIPWRSGDETEGLCCGKTEAVMSGLDGNVRSPRAGRKREIHQSFPFINHLWISLVFVLCPAIFSPFLPFCLLCYLLSHSVCLYFSLLSLQLFLI